MRICFSFDSKYRFPCESSFASNRFKTFKIVSYTLVNLLFYLTRSILSLSCVNVCFESLRFRQITLPVSTRFARLEIFSQARLMFYRRWRGCMRYKEQAIKLRIFLRFKMNFIYRHWRSIEFFPKSLQPSSNRRRRFSHPLLDISLPESFRLDWSWTWL